MEILKIQILLFYIREIKNYKLGKFFKENIPLILETFYAFLPHFISSLFYFLTLSSQASFWQINVFAENPQYKKWINVRDLHTTEN